MKHWTEDDPCACTTRDDRPPGCPSCGGTGFRRVKVTDCTRCGGLCLAKRDSTALCDDCADTELYGPMVYT